MDLRNSTALAHLPAVLHDHRGCEVFVVVMKTSLRISDGSMHPEPLPVHASDVLSPSGAVRYPSDLVPTKRGTDVICNGAVHSPGGQPIGSCLAELRLGDVRATVRAFGRRRWELRGDAWHISNPEPFRSVPLGMESAFGGRGESRNPVGRGFTDRSRGEDPSGRDLPLLEHDAEQARIAKPEDRPIPAGFAAIAPQWEPRRSYRGTFGETWERTRAPLFPEDMDARFWSAAQLVSARPLVGGESLALVNLSPSGHIETTLPRVPVRVRIDDCEERPALDLVLLEPDADRVSLTFRIAVDVTRRLDRRMPKVRIVEKRCAPLGRRVAA